MKTFVISTSSNQIRLGIFDGLKKISDLVAEKEIGLSRSENLLKLSTDLLNKAKSTIYKLDLIIVTLGPGSYTGSRGGLSFAKAMSQGSGIKIVGVSALDVIAHSAKAKNFPLTVALEAGGERFYTKNYKSDTQIFTTRDVGKIEELKNSNTKNILKTDKHPDLDEINKYGLLYYDKNGPDDFLKLLPLYLQEPNITIPKKNGNL